MTKNTSGSTAVWPLITLDDAPAAIGFLCEAFGFEKIAIHLSEDDPEHVVHGELRWPLGGGVMVTSAGEPDAPFARPSGAALVYLACDDPDGLFERSTAAGASIVRGLADEDYGSRGFTVRDPEGNIWSFGTFRGEG